MSHPSDHELAARMAELARAVAVPRRAEDIFQEVTTAAVELIPGVDTAGILLIKRGGKFESHAGTTDLPHELDELQNTLQEGPCMDAALDDLLVRTDDFRQEARWPAYSAAVQKLGVLSGLSFRLYNHERTAGALNLFGFAVMANRHGEQLRSAVASRDRIGQAKGIIMERYDLDDVGAFDMMRRLSQETNTTLVEIARRVIGTRGDR
jgi:hypothetical protein